MDVAEVIDRQLERLTQMFDDQGCWTGEQYMDLVKPLHEALLALSSKNSPESIDDSGLSLPFMPEIVVPDNPD